MTAIFVTGRLYSPVAVLTVTFRTRPSAPGYTLVTLPTAHLPLTAFMSATVLRFSTCHFFLGTKVGKTSLVQRFQHESTILCTNSTRLRGFLVSLNVPCGTSGVALPKEHVVRTQVSSVVWIVRDAPDGTLIQQVRDL